MKRNRGCGGSGWGSSPAFSPPDAVLEQLTVRGTKADSTLHERVLRILHIPLAAAKR